MRECWCPTDQRWPRHWWQGISNDRDSEVDFIDLHLFRIHTANVWQVNTWLNAPSSEFSTHWDSTKGPSGGLKASDSMSWARMIAQLWATHVTSFWHAIFYFYQSLGCPNMYELAINLLVASRWRHWEQKALELVVWVGEFFLIMNSRPSSRILMLHRWVRDQREETKAEIWLNSILPIAKSLVWIQQSLFWFIKLYLQVVLLSQSKSVCVDSRPLQTRSLNFRLTVCKGKSIRGGLQSGTFAIIDVWLKLTVHSRPPPILVLLTFVHLLIVNANIPWVMLPAGSTSWFYKSERFLTFHPISIAYFSTIIQMQLWPQKRTQTIKWWLWYQRLNRSASTTLES